MAFTKYDAGLLLHMLQTGYLGDGTYEAFLVLSGKKPYADNIPQEAIDNLVRLELGRIETPVFMFSREGGKLKNEEPTPVFILTNKGKKLAQQIP